MKWIYFGLSGFTGLSAVVIALYAEPSEKLSLIKPCIIACIVNLGIFAAMHWAQKRQKEPIQLPETTRGK